MTGQMARRILADDPDADTLVKLGIRASDPAMKALLIERIADIAAVDSQRAAKRAGRLITSLVMALVAEDQEGS